MTGARPWLDLSALGLDLWLTTTPAGRDYQIVMASPERMDLEGAEGVLAKNLVAIGFRAIHSSVDGRCNHVRPVISLMHDDPCGVDDIARALPGALPVPFDPKAHVRVLPKDGPAEDPNDPGPVLRRLAAQLARHAVRHGLDAEAALREATAMTLAGSGRPPRGH